MKRFCCFLIFLLPVLVSTALATAAQPTATEQIRRELEAVINERCVAIRTRDVRKDLGFLAADYSYKLPNGKIVTRQEIEKLGVVEQNGNTILEISQAINKLKMLSGEAVLEIVIHQRVSQKMRDGRDAILTNEWVERQTWHKNSAGWQLRSTEWLRNKKRAIEGMTFKEYQTLSPLPPADVQPNEEDRASLNQGNALVFIYRLEDHALPKTSVYCDDSELAALTRATYIKVKLPPGTYQFKSEKEPALALKLQSGGLYFLEVKLRPGLPAKGQLSREDTWGAQFYQLPQAAGLKPLNHKHIKDQTKVIVP